MGLAALVLRRGDADVATVQRQVFAGDKFGAVHVQTVARLQRHVAVHAADDAALVRHILRRVGGFQALRANST